MVLEEGQPPFARITPAAYAAEIPSHGSFRHLETELLKFAVDLGCAPTGILFCHLADEPSNLLGDLRPTAVRAGSPTPVQVEAGAMPADDSFGLDDDEYLGLARPDAMQGNPKQPVERVQRRPRPFPLENSHLLSQGKNFQGGVAATSEEDTNGLKERGDENRHGISGFSTFDARSS